MGPDGGAGGRRVRGGAPRPRPSEPGADRPPGRERAMNQRLVGRVIFPLHERLKRKPTFERRRELERTQWLRPPRPGREPPPRAPPPLPPPAPPQPPLPRPVPAHRPGPAP